MYFVLCGPYRQHTAQHHWSADWCTKFGTCSKCSSSSPGCTQLNLPPEIPGISLPPGRRQHAVLHDIYSYSVAEPPDIMRVIGIAARFFYIEEEAVFLFFYFVILDGRGILPEFFNIPI